MIELEFQDGEENLITLLDMGETKPGIETSNQTFRLTNTGDVDASVTIYSDSSDENQEGESYETYNATWLSLNGLDYKNTIHTRIAVDDFKEVYVKWRPTSDSTPGDKQWSIAWHVEQGNIEDICDPLS